MARRGSRGQKGYHGSKLEGKEQGGSKRTDITEARESIKKIWPAMGIAGLHVPLQAI
jgi:hypothetical protein